EELRSRYDAVVIATGARVPRDLPVPGRELDGVHFAMDYLYQRNRWVAGAPEPDHVITAAGKHVIVIGGGDTGADCVANAHREEPASVTQIELVGEPPVHRPDESTPWPRWPLKLRGPYALKEGGVGGGRWGSCRAAPRGRGGGGGAEGADSRAPRPSEPPRGAGARRPADLVLLAMGFLGPEPALLEALGVERDERGNARATNY